MRLALGTAQLGMDYGVAGAGRVPPDEADAILHAAADAGIDTLDTAADYGASEAVIGACSARGRFRIVSKTPALGDEDPAPALRPVVERSLQRLGVEHLHGLLVHRADDLLGPGGDAAWASLATLRREGVVGRIGVSVYGPDELAAVRERFRPDLVQAPLNLLDQRLLAADVLPALRRDGTEVHVRSVFLQGLLTMPAARRPAWTARWRRELAAADAWIAASGLPAAGACLRFALEQPAVDRVVVGVDGRAQLQELLGHAREPAELPDAAALACHDEALILPYRWPR